MATSLSRMNSNPAQSKDVPLTFDQQSRFISGILDQKKKDVHDFYSDDEDTDGCEATETYEKLCSPIEANSVKRADDVLFQTYGIRVLETLASSILNGKIKEDDLVVQSVAYRCQKELRGKVVLGT